MPKGYWKAFGQFLKGKESHREMPKYQPLANRREGRIDQRQSAETWEFPFISPELLHKYIKLVKKSKTHETFSRNDGPLIANHYKSWKSANPLTHF
jgi:hypothetical protein